MKVIIAGGRDFDNQGRVDFEMDMLAEVFLSSDSDIEVVSGMARGADHLGANWGLRRNWVRKYFPADWDTYGKSAGYRRNAEMADYADVLVAFWDGKSRGTKHMIDLALEKGLECHIYRY